MQNIFFTKEFFFCVCMYFFDFLVICIIHNSSNFIVKNIHKDSEIPCSILRNNILDQKKFR